MHRYVPRICEGRHVVEKRDMNKLIILGGGVAQMDDLLLEPARQIKFARNRCHVS